ncbi:MAG: hypothetical protein KKH20_01165, partial [Proteobacteria bacterium]|nr:hypothetical protein [Desulfobacteraceae bacterium]MBU4099972.1 hypothetical protein [Pseudomonadota bacterium]
MIGRRILICFFVFCTLLLFKANSHAEFQKGDVLIYNTPESQSALEVEVGSVDNGIVLASHFQMLTKRTRDLPSWFYYRTTKTSVLKPNGDGNRSITFNSDTSLNVASEPSEDRLFGLSLKVTKKKGGISKDTFLILKDPGENSLPPVYDMIGFLFSFHLQNDLNSVPARFFLLEKELTPRVGIRNIGTDSYTSIYTRPGEPLTQQCTKFELFWQNEPNEPWSEVWISNRDRLPLKIVLNKIIFNFRRKYSNEENIKRLEWVKWQGEMEGAFNAAEGYEDNRNYTYKEKLDKWTEFIADYKDDNPDSTKDKDLKIKAHARKEYWLDKDMGQWASWQEDMDDDFKTNINRDRRGRLSPTKMKEMWTSFITDYEYNNIYDNKDEDLRQQAQQKADKWSKIINTWAERQRKMNEAFNDEKRNEANTELSSIEKANVWEKFLTTYMNDNPDSKDDDEIREKASERVKKWKETDRAEWKDYQQNMKNAFDEAEKQATKDELSAKEKVGLWKTFIDNYKIDNPHSEDDTKLINKATNYYNKWIGEVEESEET